MGSATLAGPPVREAARMSWALITGEYPPQAGGVSDYTHGLARMLAANGDSVTVFAPPCAGTSPSDPGVHVHRLSDTFGSHGRAELHAELARIPAPRAAVLQYVPQSFGMKGCNLPFILSLRALHGYPLWVMFHEVTVTVRPSTPLKYRIQALATRAMAVQTLAIADATFISTERWGPLLRGLRSRIAPPVLAPIPSNIALHSDAAARKAIRDRFAPAAHGMLFGHFGTYRDAAMRETLNAVVPRLLERTPGAHMLFLGKGSAAFAETLRAAEPAMRERIFGSGGLEATGVANHLASCDVLLQPYEDGVTTRRGSIIASLALGIPVVTTSGVMTEALWSESGAVALSPDGELDAFIAGAHALATDSDRRIAMSTNACALYRRTFAMEHTVAALRARSAQERLVRS